MRRYHPLRRLTSISVALALAGFATASAAEDPDTTSGDLVGTRAPDWDGVEWLDREPLRLEELRGKVVLVRWWTDTCPYCRRSAPALNEFHARFASRDLVVIGMYHPKPLGRAITADEIREAARERGFDFPIAIDRDWSVLRRWWLDGAPRGATSVSFLIGRDGVIRHVHPGPAFHREIVRGDEQPSKDFAELNRLIDRVLDDSS